MRPARVLLALAAVTISVGWLPSPASGAPELPAFPGAEGFGAGATGGRGGDVMIVTTLEPFGPGSLGDALAPEACRPRTVVFRVSGVIEVPGKHDLELTCGNITIAGQTAPGAGITVAGRVDGYGADPGGNIIMRHVRFRPPPISDEEGAVDNLGQIYDALQLSNNSNMMLDHLSLSWGSDETVDMHEYANDSTLQWSTIEQSNPEGQAEGPHNDGMMVGPDSPRVSIHHVLFAHHEARCPAMGTGPAEFINSIVYDCKDAFVHHNAAEGEFHIAGNTFVHGPSHEEFTPLFFDDEEPGGTTYWLYQNAFVAPGQFEGVADDISDTPLAEGAFYGAGPDQVISAPSDFSQAADSYAPVSMQAPGDAYEAVLAQAGAFPRDAMTNETIDDVRNGTGDWDPDPPDNLVEGLTAAESPADDDEDGMADDWETENGLDPDDGDDHGTTMPSGYSAIEEYVNGLSDAIVGSAPPGPAVSPPSGETGVTTDPTQPGTGPDEAAAAAPAQDDDSTLVVLALGLAAVAVATSGVTLYLYRRRTRPPPAA